MATSTDEAKHTALGRHHYLPEQDVAAFAHARQRTDEPNKADKCLAHKWGGGRGAEAENQRQNNSQPETQMLLKRMREHDSDAQ